MQARFPVCFCWQERMMRSRTLVPSASVSVAVLKPEAEKEQLNFKSVSVAAVLIDWWFDRQVESCWGRTLIGQTLSAFACLEISSAHFLHVRDAFCLAGRLIPPHPPRTRGRFSSLEFSPFSPGGSASSGTAEEDVQLREGERCCGRGGRVSEDGNGGFQPFSSHHLATVRASWSHAGVLCCVGAPTVPTFDINLCPGEIYAQPLLAAPRWWWWHLSARFAGHTK